MAEELNGYQVEQVARPEYQWDQWFNGSWWKLTKGQDFERPVEGMRTYAFNQAKKRGYRLTTKAAGDHLWIMATPDGQDPRPTISAGEVLQEPVKATRGRNSKYPEEIWDGQPRAFYPGKDFREGCQEGFRQAIRAAATYRGTSVKTSVRMDGAVVVQAMTKVDT